ncbi:hypothetical protein BsIDN1_35990 [Bacillus safensis]|uniref:Major facilitator superfamily (MFS) profile domain-containing protein n=1 Tax=Bacillus safensis TaxID=561879 RepID=A0A5S9MAQ7_BACIA|nr:hypothetical protein BsIDN1_35990 [Bacillus safensis]
MSSLPALPVVIALLFAGMMCLGMGNGAVFQLVPQVFHKEIGIVTGIVGAAGGIGGFFLPNILGSLKELTGSYTFGFFLTISLFVLIVFLCLVVSQLKRKKVLINHTISES